MSVDGSPPPRHAPGEILRARAADTDRSGAPSVAAILAPALALAAVVGTVLGAPPFPLTLIPLSLSPGVLSLAWGRRGSPTSARVATVLTAAIVGLPVAALGLGVNRCTGAEPLPYAVLGGGGMVGVLLLATAIGRVPALEGGVVRPILFAGVVAFVGFLSVVAFVARSVFVLC